MKEHSVYIFAKNGIIYFEQYIFIYGMVSLIGHALRKKDK